MVTVAELIAHLQRLPPEMPVVTPGFDESGFEDVSVTQGARLQGLAKITSYSGQYVEADSYGPDYYSGEPFEAVVINFGD